MENTDDRYPQYYRTGNYNYWALLAPHHHVSVNTEKPSCAQVIYDSEKENSPVYDELQRGSLHYVAIQKTDFMNALQRVYDILLPILMKD